MASLDEIEREIEGFSSSSDKRWQKLAEMIIAVERNSTWQENPSNRNFTVWVESLAGENLSKSWLWQVYTAGLTLERIAIRRQPGLKDKPMGAIFELYPNCSVGALSSLNSINGIGVGKPFLKYLEDEYVEEKLSVTQLNLISKEIRRCRKAGLDKAEAFAALFKVDFNEVLGFSGTRQKILTDLPAGTNVDAICVLPSSEDIPQFLGIVIWRGNPVTFPASVEWRLIIKSHLDGEVPSGPYGVMALDLVSGRYEVLVPPEKVEAADESRYRLGMGIINTLLVPSAPPVMVT